MAECHTAHQRALNKLARLHRDEFADLLAGERLRVGLAAERSKARPRQTVDVQRGPQRLPARAEPKSKGRLMWCHTHQTYGTVDGRCWYAADQGLDGCDLRLACPNDHLTGQQTGRHAAHPQGGPDREHR